MTAAETLEKIKTLFERDEAVTVYNDPLGMIIECPICGAPAVIMDDMKMYRLNFCPHCGQRLKWEDET